MTKASKQNLHCTLASVLTLLMLFPVLLPLKAAELDIANVPVFLTSPVNPNILIILDNSNSMDERPDGSIAVGGSTSSESKSEIARTVMKDVINDYQDRLNIGLMAYKQENSGTNAVAKAELHNALVDVAYSATPPYAHDPAFEGAITSTTKRIQHPNPADPGSFIYANVSIPFYHQSNQGRAFCYSPTANAFNNGEDPVTGPFDTYRCFNDKTGASNDLPIWQSTGDEAGKGYSSYLFTMQMYPTDSDIAQGITDFGKYLFWEHVGQAWHANASPGRGYLHVPIDGIDTAQKTDLDTKLGTSQFASNQIENVNFPLQNAGLTPLEGTLRSAGDYFSGNPNNDEGYTQAICDALPESCDKNFVILVTDGMPSVNEDGAAPATPAEAITRVRQAAKDLLEDDPLLSDDAKGIKTYVVGFALPFGVDASQLDSIAEDGGTAEAYDAANEESLQAAIHSILSDIFEQVASSAPITFSSNTLTVEDEADENNDDLKTFVYQTKFNSANWTGEVSAYTFEENLAGDTVLKDTPEWTVNDTGQIKDYDQRVIVTSTRQLTLCLTPPCDYVGNMDAAGFRWDELTTTDKALFNDSEELLNYIRGDRSLEGTTYRVRDQLVGDIINSEPIYVSKPFYHYPDSMEDKPYSDFIDKYWNLEENRMRRPMLYFGANDGMLHAVDGRTGEEVFAYIPNSLFKKLPELAKRTYSHEFYVDGSPTIVDAYFHNNWHTVLAGGLNGGGQGIYALDISSPELFVSEANVKDAVLWEFSDKNDKDMGYSYSQPNIVKLHNDKWGVVFGNGYNNTEDDGSGVTSTTGNAVLYILDVSNGAPIAKIDTMIGKADDPLGLDRPNGLATVAPIDLNNDRKIDVIYAGDLFGNLWKFDVSDSDPSNWGVAFGSSSNPLPLFTTEAIDGSPQPIMVRPEVGRHKSRGGVLIYFGTGKYIEVADNTRDNQTTQTLYALWDDGSRITNRNELQKQEIIKEGEVLVPADDGSYNPVSYRVTTDNTVDWANKRGWYIDLINTEGGNTDNEGERVIYSAALRDNRIIFTSMLPTDDVCEPGGSGWMMEFDAQQGSRVSDVIYDLDNDGQANDKVNIGTTSSPEMVSVSGLQVGVGLPTSPGFVGTGNTGDLIMATGSDGNIVPIRRFAARSLGRQSWRQVY